MRIRHLFAKAGAIAGFVSALSLAGLPAAVAQEEGNFGVRIGVLNCQIAGGFGFIFGSSREINCVFQGANGVTESYSGRINNFGVDIGYRSEGVMIWGVFAPSADVAQPGALAGTYAGVGAQAALGLGVGGRILVGGLRDSIALQPFSIEGVAGFNIAAGIASLRLASDQVPQL